jgi:hypothetical protein
MSALYGGISSSVVETKIKEDMYGDGHYTERENC